MAFQQQIPQPHPSFDDEVVMELELGPDMLGTTQEISTPPVTLGWEHLSYHVTIKKKKQEPTRRCILNDVSGVANPGHLLAIMGPSGAGKTSLLNALAGRLPKANAGELTGEITVNGRPREEWFPQLVGYVMQDDVFFANLTVLETLTLTARLKLPRRMSKAEKMEAVEAMLRELSLVQVKNTRIGATSAGGISGGEKKRLNVASELITRAPILFLDEPTSSLDAFQALNVMTCLRQVASAGRAVVCTIHQPRSSIYALFDRLLLLSQGRIMYHGDAQAACEYFEVHGFACPQHFNPADHFLDVIAIDQRTDDIRSETEARVATLAAAYDATDTEREAIMELQRLRAGPPLAIPPDARGYEVPWLEQFLLLSKRAFQQLSRDKFGFIIDASVRMFLSLVLGFVYFQLDFDQKAIQGRTGLLFFVLIQVTFAQMSAVQGTFPSEQLVVNRERQSRMYHVSAYYLAKTVMEIVLKFWSPLLFAIVVYWMAWLNPHITNFLVFTLAYLLMATLGTALGLLISAMAPNVQAAGVMGPVILIVLLLGGGFYQNLEKSAVWMIWLQYISPFRYGFGALMVNEFHGVNFTCDGDEDQGRCLATGADVLEYYSIDDNLSVMWLFIGVLGVFIVAIHSLAFLLLRLKLQGSYMPLSNDSAWTRTKRRADSVIQGTRRSSNPNRRSVSDVEAGDKTLSMPASPTENDPALRFY